MLSATCVLGQLRAESAGTGSWEDVYFDEVFCTRPCLKATFAAIFIYGGSLKGAALPFQSEQSPICQNCSALFKQKLQRATAADGNVSAARLSSTGVCVIECVWCSHCFVVPHRIFNAVFWCLNC